MLFRGHSLGLFSFYPPPWVDPVFSLGFNCIHILVITVRIFNPAPQTICITGQYFCPPNGPWAHPTQICIPPIGLSSPISLWPTTDLFLPYVFLSVTRCKLNSNVKIILYLSLFFTCLHNPISGAADPSYSPISHAGHSFPLSIFLLRLQ